MKNYKINPNKLSKLTRLSVDLFDIMNEEIVYSPNRGEKATQMHFVADLLKDLIDTAYPAKEIPYCMGFDKATEEEFSVIALDLDFKSFEEALKKVSEVMKDYKPPKAGEF